MSSTTLGLRRERLAVTMLPAMLNARSEAADVAGIAKYTSARFHMRGNSVL